MVGSERTSIDARVAMSCVVLASVVLLAMISFPASDGSVADELFPKPVRGYATDILGNPIEGANVTIKMMNGTTVVKTYYYDSTEPDGWYGATFAPNEWSRNNTIEVTARYNSQTVTNSTIANLSIPVQWVNVTFSFAIPEFGPSMVLVVSGVVAMFAVFHMRRKRQFLELP